MNGCGMPAAGALASAAELRLSVGATLISVRTRYSAWPVSVVVGCVV